MHVNITKQLESIYVLNHNDDQFGFNFKLNTLYIDRDRPVSDKFNDVNLLRVSCVKIIVLLQNEVKKNSPIYKFYWKFRTDFNLVVVFS